MTTNKTQAHTKYPQWHGARFKTLLQTQWIEYKRSYLTWLAVVASVHLLWMVGFLLISQPIGHEGFAFGYWLGLIIFGAIFASNYFKGLSHKGHALIWLMKPASAREKFTLAFLTTVIGFFIAYTLTYTLVSLPMSWFSQALATFQDRSYINNSIYVPSGKYPMELGEEIMLSISYLFSTGFMASLSLYFHKHPMLRACLVAFVLFVITIFIMAATRSNGNDALMLWFDTNTQSSQPLLAHVLSGLFWIGTPILIWLSAYQNLMDRELR